MFNRKALKKKLSIFESACFQLQISRRDHAFLLMFVFSLVSVCLPLLYYLLAVNYLLTKQISDENGISDGAY